MRKLILIVFVVFSVSSLEASTVTEQDLLGTWVPVHRSTGALGTMMTFHAGGTLDEVMGAIVETWYRMKGDTIEGPGPTTNSKPTAMRIRFKNNTFQKVGDPARYVRVGKAETGAPPIVGVWRLDPESAARSVAQMQKAAGHPIDDQTAKKTAESISKQTVEYTRDGLIKFRLPMLTTPGTFDVTNQTFTIAGRNGHFRLENGLLILRQPDGKSEDAFIREGASKEQMKNAGIRYGDKPAELEPPRH
jgi:hypothetical protein